MARIKLRRDTSANWTAVNPVLLEGEPGLELDSGKTKYGNGTSTWTQLPYSATTGADGVVGGVSYSVVNSGASAYTIAGTANPALTLVKGFTYYFNVAATGHPFWIKTSAVTGTTSAYSSGVTNNGTESGTVSFTVPFNAPATLYYICQYHGSMVGTLNIADSMQGGGSITGLVSDGTSTVTLSSGFNLIPETNVLQDLGSPTNRFKDLYLSGNTIDLGGATISSDNGALALPVGTKIGTVSVNFDSFGNNILPPGSDLYDIGSISALWRYVYGAVFVGNMLQQWSPSGTVRSVRIDRILAKTSQSVPTTPVGTGPDSNTGYLGDKLGDVTWSATHMYVCTANWDGVANIWKRISWGSDTWT